MDTEELISYLKELKDQESSFLSSIRDFDLLITALNELNNLIEMKEIKNSIVSQIKFLLINAKNFDGHMLHTVLSGGPGTGKTEVGTILAKIWTALGLINKPKPKKLVIVPNPSSSDDEDFDKTMELEKHIQNLTSSGKIKNNVVKNLQEYISQIKNSLKEIDQKIKLGIFQLKTMKRNGLLKSIDETISLYQKLQTEIEKIYKNSIPDETINFSITLINKNIEKEIDLLISDLENFKPAKSKSVEYIKPKTFNTPIENRDLIRIVSREDLVAGYLGQSALKTEKILQESIGKVLFIDEAYSLVNDDKDSYGKEVLTTLNRFMSEHSSEIVIIFAGYKDMLDSTIFKYQPGLKRRCSWFFNIKGYSEIGLSYIFQKQLKKNGWKIDVDLIPFFKEHIKEFPHFGGDTLRLAFYCKICYSEKVFDNEYPNEKIINKEILDNAMKYLLENRISEPEMDVSVNFMYI